MTENSLELNSRERGGKDEAARTRRQGRGGENEAARTRRQGRGGEKEAARTRRGWLNSESEQTYQNYNILTKQNQIRLSALALLFPHFPPPAYSLVQPENCANPWGSTSWNRQPRAGGEAWHVASFQRNTGSEKHKSDQLAQCSASNC